MKIIIIKKICLPLHLKNRTVSLAKEKKKKVVKRDYPEISNCCQYEVACFHGY